MSQGIVKAKPRPGTMQMGQVQITVAEPYRNIYLGATYSFDDPGFTVELNSTVECTIDEHQNQFCTVTKIISPPPPKHHGHDAPPVPADEDQQ